MSQATIEAALRGLLIEEGRACLPGIGTLVVEAQPALVSLMEGKASPPSKYVSFNGNLTLDDGRLRQEVGDADAVDRYLDTVRQSLTEDEPFALPGIGKLYRQGTEEVRFTPGAINLSKASFGLPEVAVRPIARKEAVAGSPSSRRGQRAVATKRPAPPQPPTTTRWVWYLAAGVGVLLAIFLVFRLAGTIGVLLENPERTSSDRMTLPPPPPPAPQPAVIDAAAVRPDGPPQLTHVPSPPEATPTTEAVATTPASDENEAIIVIGLFGRERNVRKQTRRLTEAGYTPYTDREGRNTRVGLTVRYRNESELRRVLADVRQRYTEDAFVMRVNGRERRPQ